MNKKDFIKALKKTKKAKKLVFNVYINNEWVELDYSDIQIDNDITDVFFTIKE